MSGKPNTTAGLVYWNGATNGPTMPCTLTGWFKAPTSTYLFDLLNNWGGNTGNLSNEWPRLNGPTWSARLKNTTSMTIANNPTPGSGWFFLACSVTNLGVITVRYWAEADTTATTIVNAYNPSDNNAWKMSVALGDLEYGVNTGYRCQYVRLFSDAMTEADAYKEKNSGSGPHADNSANCKLSWYWNGNATPTDQTGNGYTPTVSNWTYDDADNPTLSGGASAPVAQSMYFLRSRNA